MILDIILELNTAFYENGVLTKTKSVIMNYYIKNKLIYDLFIIIPFIITSYAGFTYFKMIIVFRVY